MSGIIFFVCWISWISRCSLAAISFFQTENKPPCQREDRKAILEKVRLWRSRKLCIWWWRDQDLGIWCRTIFFPVRGKILCKVWAIPKTRRMPKRNKAVLLPVSGNRGETQATIQPSSLKWRSRMTLKMQIPGSRKRKVNLHTQPAFGNKCEVWIHSWLRQKQTFVTWRFQIIRTWRRFTNICGKVGNHREFIKIWNRHNEDQCTDVGIIHVIINESSRSSWTYVYREFGGIQEYEFRGDPDFVRYHSEFDIWTTLKRIWM